MKINFTISNDMYTLTDALLLSDDIAYTQEEILAMQQARFDAWVATMNTPVIPEDL
jgi:hypothetical protein